MATRERRNYYRINYPVAIEYKQVTRNELLTSQESTHFDVSPYFSLQLQLSELESQTQHLLTKVAEVNPNVAACQRLLNDKIEIIGKTLSQSELRIESAHIHNINLSEAGFSYIGDEPMELGTLLALKMVFPTSAMGILIYAEVVRCIKTEGGYDLGLKFLKMPERVRTALAKIIIQAQVRQRRVEDEGAGIDTDGIPIQH